MSPIPLDDRPPINPDKYTVHRLVVPELRKVSQISESALAVELGCSPASAGHILRGDGNTRPKVLHAQRAYWYFARLAEKVINELPFRIRALAVTAYDLDEELLHSHEHETSNLSNTLQFEKDLVPLLTEFQSLINQAADRNPSTLNAVSRSRVGVYRVVRYAANIDHDSTSAAALDMKLTDFPDDFRLRDALEHARDHIDAFITTSVLRIFPAPTGIQYPNFELYFPQRNLKETNKSSSYQIVRNTGRLIVIKDYLYLVGLTSEINPYPLLMIISSDGDGSFMKGLVVRRHHKKTIILANCEFHKIGEDDPVLIEKEKLLCGYYLESSADFIEHFGNLGKPPLNLSERLGKAAMRMVD